ADLAGHLAAHLVGLGAQRLGAVRLPGRPAEPQPQQDHHRRQQPDRLDRAQRIAALALHANSFPLGTPSHRTPVWPKPPSPRSLGAKSSTCRRAALATGRNTSWATRSPGSIRMVAPPRFHRLTISGPW